MAKLISIPIPDCDLCAFPAAVRVLRHNGKTHGDYCHRHGNSAYAQLCGEEAAEATRKVIEKSLANRTAEGHHTA